MSRRGGRNDLQSWKERFVQRMWEQKPQDKWTLDIPKDLNLSPHGWYQYEQKGVFARFKCSSCLNEWKSIRVIVHFHIRLEKCRWGPSQGQVKTQIFRQRCHRCLLAKYEEPVFSDEAVQKLLHNLVLKILEKCYGEHQKRFDFFNHDAEEDVEGPHDRGNCEACERGICSASSDFGRIWVAQSAQQEEVPNVSDFPNVLGFLLVLLVILFFFFVFSFQKK